MKEKENEFIEDMTVYGYWSDCCSAPIIMGDICRDCLEHCEAVEEDEEY